MVRSLGRSEKICLERLDGRRIKKLYMETKATLLRSLKTKFKESRAYRYYLIPSRFKLAVSYYRKPLKEVLQWTFNSRENTNLTYELEATNKAYLSSFVAAVTRVDVATIRGYLDEIDSDQELRDHIIRLTRSSPFRNVADDQARCAGEWAGQRLAGRPLPCSCGNLRGATGGIRVLAAALKGIKRKDSRGTYFGTDINPQAGYLFEEPYNRQGQILYGDSIESLKGLDREIDLFINDSDHSADYEARERYNRAFKAF